jgi:hypothetical protein
MICANDRLINRGANNASMLSQKFPPNMKQGTYDYKKHLAEMTVGVALRSGILNRHLNSSNMLQTINVTVLLVIEQAEN